MYLAQAEYVRVNVCGMESLEQQIFWENKKY